MSNIDYVATLHRGIASLIQQFQCNSFDFLYEADLQAMLFALTKKEFQKERISMRGGFHSSVPEYDANESVRTVPVKCEYPSEFSFDVAIMEPSIVEHYDPTVSRQRGWGNERFWNQPLRAAVELKYYQLGDSRGHRLEGVDRDIEKLLRYSRQYQDRAFLGIALLFIQSVKMDVKDFCLGREIDSDPVAGVYRFLVNPQEYRRFEA